MQIKKTVENDTVTYKIYGKIDTNTSPELQKEIVNPQEGIKNLILDLEDVDYISSAGLRVLLLANQNMSKIGEMKVINASENVKGVFEITGFDDILKTE